MGEEIRVRGARQNNLKGVDLSIPRRALVVLTGPSGSGKSSLAFDTIYAEGQRRYVESLSTYAKQFLERMPKPSVDGIEGVSPSVAIDQRNTVQSSRSTVGTVTEVYDYLRLLWARAGDTICPDCGRAVVPDTVQSATDRLLGLDPEARLSIGFPLMEASGVSPELLAANLRSRGYLRVLAGGAEIRLDEVEALPEGEGKERLVVVDRVVAGSAERGRVADSLAAAFAEGHGTAVALVGPGRERIEFSESFRCPDCDRAFPDPTPGLFSFNHPTGACPTCNGFGANLEYDLDLIVPDPGRSLADGAIDPWTKPRYHREHAALLAYACRRGADPAGPWRTLPEGLREELVHGCDDFVGVIPFLRSRERKRYKQYIRVFLRQYQRPHECPDCGGTRLRPEAGHVRVGGLSIAEAAALTIDRVGPWLDDLSLPPFRAAVAETVLREIRDRIGFLARVGLGYLTLDRQARSLSGGEMQRIRLAGSLGSRLSDTLYVLDEPTIGLHARDVRRFLDVLESLRDRGNTVLVVEHETAVLARADRLVELGPGSGEHGGEVVFEGDWNALLAADTTTGRALAAPPPEHSGEPLPAAGRRLKLRGATLHNIRGLDVEIPLGVLTVVTGVSGSGKSTLVHDILYRSLERELEGASSARRHLGERAGTVEALEGASALDGVLLVDQSPIGRTPRSNPVTYIKAWDEVRRLFAEQPLARSRGYGPGHFSFNVKGGRCEACKGAGAEIVEMVFMADVAVPCDACGGRRFRPEILDVRYRDRSVHDVLRMTVDEALRFFIRRDRLGKALWQLQRVGLGYLRLGQPATTLSGGEAQRLKIARELGRPARGHRLYLLDEPTVGLGLGEIDRLVTVLEDLVRAGHTVVVIEHNLDVIARAQWILDLGPEAADDGGRLVAAGTPADVMAAPASHTGRYLRERLSGSTAAGDRPTSARPAVPRTG